MNHQRLDVQCEGIEGDNFIYSKIQIVVDDEACNSRRKQVQSVQLECPSLFGPLNCQLQPMETLWECGGVPRSKYIV